MKSVRQTILRVVRQAGSQITRVLGDEYPRDLEAEFIDVFEACEPYTMTSTPRMYALWQATRHILHNRIPGDYVECGVWRGGSSMLVARLFEQHHACDRSMYLYDTYCGMVQPQEVDIDPSDRPAALQWEKAKRDDGNDWCYASADEVRGNMDSCGFPMERVHLVEGKVEETIPRTVPDAISLLRLDTDWYESTLHELRHLYPRLVQGGVLILDDYGYWQGAKKAVDEYFAEFDAPPLLTRIDNSGRLAIKQ